MGVVENYRKYKVPISKTMDIDTMSQVWEEADSIVKNENAELSQTLAQAKAQYNLAKVLYKGYIVSKKIKDNLSKTIEAGSAAQQSIVQYPAIVIQEEGSKGALDTSSETYDTLKDQIPL